MKVTTSDNKYTVTDEGGVGLRALRYGEPWRECVGDNLIYMLAANLVESREDRSKLLAMCKQFQVLAKGDGKITHDSMLADALNKIVSDVESKNT